MLHTLPVADKQHWRRNKN